LQLDINNANELKAGDSIYFTLFQNTLQGYSFRLSQTDLDTLNSNSTAAISAETLYVSNNGLVNGYSVSLSGNPASGTLNITLTHPSISDDFFVLNTVNPSLSQFNPSFFRGELGVLNRLILTPPEGNKSVMNTLDKAINEMSLKMSKVGSYINRLETAADVTSEMNKNLTSSRSRMTDTDYSKETVNLSRAKITSQAATSMLKKSQDMKKLVMALLR
jgi:flagellin-like hook-associated protein FlgL